VEKEMTGRSHTRKGKDRPGIGPVAIPIYRTVRGAGCSQDEK